MAKLDNIINKSDKDWRQELSPEQYYILREGGTEKPFSGELLLNKQNGVYLCSACGSELFSSESKFESNSGWPSFDDAIKAGNVTTMLDDSHGMVRTEIRCAKCGGHLGHLFNDGPTKTGMRYCVNSLSLDFLSQDDVKTNSQTDTIVLGGGCFWCVEALLKRLDGVINVESGYSGGRSLNPTYEEVATGISGHIEVVRVTFNPKKIALRSLLKTFFDIHDPTSQNRQGADVGAQYKSVIFVKNKTQKKIAEATMADLERKKIYPHPIVTEIKVLKKFYKADDYHQDYYQNNMKDIYCQRVIKPKLEKLENYLEKHV